jgi:hydrogenase nickel incorporation protein HypB
MTHVTMERKVLSENDRLAGRLREGFRRSGVLCLNLISSPGAGKTALLERTLEGFDASARVAVLTGDIQTDNDAVRLARFGFPVRQITTGGACHLDARMVERGLSGWALDQLEMLFVENVGNLVCPSSYDLGEAAKVVIVSLTEGEDKPLKYPGIFSKAELLVLSKIDLLPHLSVEPARVRENARKVNPGIQILELSSVTGEGLPAWRQWLTERLAAMKAGLGEAAGAG